MDRRDAEAEAARDLLAHDDEWVLRSHGALETVRTIRRLEYHRFLSAHEAERIVEESCSAEVLTVPPEPWLLKHIWELRHTISPYDAAYLVLSRHFDCRLITFDERLTRAATPHGVHVTVPGSGPAAAQRGHPGSPLKARCTRLNQK